MPIWQCCRRLNFRNGSHVLFCVYLFFWRKQKYEISTATATHTHFTPDEHEHQLGVTWWIFFRVEIARNSQSVLWQYCHNFTHISFFHTTGWPFEMGHTHTKWHDFVIKITNFSNINVFRSTFTVTFICGFFSSFFKW